MKVAWFSVALSAVLLSSVCAHAQDAGVFDKWLNEQSPQCVPVSAFKTVSTVTELTPEQFQFVRALYVALPPVSRTLPPGDHAIMASSGGAVMLALVADGQACARFLAPDFIQKIKNYRCLGTVAKINLALSALPEFTALKTKGNGNLLHGRIQISPEIDYLERAFDESKYGNFSRKPYLEITSPSLSDPSLAPAGQHVMSIYMQYAPYKLKDTDWESQRTALGETVVKTIAQYAPNLPQIILRHQIITPKDLEETYGLTGGHIFHGELALDQFFTMRPLLDWARYQTPIERLYLCGSGTHPGTGLTGGSGANAAREIVKALKK